MNPEAFYLTLIAQSRLVRLHEHQSINNLGWIGGIMLYIFKLRRWVMDHGWSFS